MRYCERQHELLLRDLRRRVLQHLRRAGMAEPGARVGRPRTRDKAATMRGLIVAFSLALGGIAHADTSTSSTVSQMMVLEMGDPSYKLFHGAVWLDFDKA